MEQFGSYCLIATIFVHVAERYMRTIKSVLLRGGYTRILYLFLRWGYLFDNLFEGIACKGREGSWGILRPQFDWLHNYKNILSTI